MPQRSEMKEKMMNAHLIPIKIQVNGRLTIPIQIRREFGLEVDNWLFAHSKKEKGVIILYTQNYFQLIPRVPEGEIEEQKDNQPTDKEE